MDTWDVVVVGAGITGSCTAYYAQKAGLRTLLLEQFSCGHSYGSSAGKSRIIRYAHTDREYLPLVKEAFKMIGEMERKRGERLWIKTGLLWMGKKIDVEGIGKILDEFDCENEILTSAEVTKRYPQFHYDDKCMGLVDPMAGVILADKWIEAFQDEFKKLGGQIAENTRVNSFKEDGLIRLLTNNGPISARKAVIAVGTWINKLVPNFPVESRNELISVAYWVPKKKEDEHLTMPDKYPVVCINTEGIGFYSLPSVDYKGAVKFAYHQGEVYDIDKELVTFNPKFIDATRNHLAEHVPFLETQNGPWRIDRCKYAMTPDEHYIVDFLPNSKNIVICGCLSGTGFKNGPPLGLALTQMIKGEKPFVDVSPFSLKRFQNKSKL